MYKKRLSPNLISSFSFYWVVCLCYYIKRNRQIENPCILLIFFVWVCVCVCVTRARMDASVCVCVCVYIRHRRTTSKLSNFPLISALGPEFDNNRYRPSSLPPLTTRWYNSLTLPHWKHSPRASLFLWWTTLLFFRPLGY